MGDTSDPRELFLTRICSNIRIKNIYQLDELGGLRQLECSHYVLPGAKHSRFEYSLGLRCLSGQLLNALMLKQQTAHWGPSQVVSPSLIAR